MTRTDKNEALHDHVLRLYDGGRGPTQAQIAAQVGVTRQRVGAILKTAGLGDMRRQYSGRQHKGRPRH